MRLSDKMKVTICSSAHFYKHAVTIQTQLQKAGVEVVIPATAEKMKLSGNYDVVQYKTWFADDNDYHKKAHLMREHFDRIAEGDAVLVLNYEKHGLENYIGGNVLMEMSLAFYLHKPIYILNEIPTESGFLEEIKGMSPVILHGRVEALLA